MNNVLKLMQGLLLAAILLHFGQKSNAQSVDIKDYYITGLIKDKANPDYQDNFIITFDQEAANIYTINHIEALPYTVTPNQTNRNQYTVNINNGDYLFFLDQKGYADRLSPVKTPAGIYGQDIAENFSTIKIPAENQLVGKQWKGSRRSVAGIDVEKEIYYVFSDDKYLSYPKGQIKTLSDGSGTAYHLIGNVAFYRTGPGYAELGIIGTYGLSCTMKAKIGNKILYTLLDEQP